MNIVIKAAELYKPGFGGINKSIMTNNPLKPTSFHVPNWYIDFVIATPEGRRIMELCPSMQRRAMRQYVHEVLREHMKSTRDAQKLANDESS